MSQTMYIVSPCIFEPSRPNCQKNQTQPWLIELDYQNCVFMTDSNIYGLKYTWSKNIYGGSGKLQLDGVRKMNSEFIFSRFFYFHENIERCFIK